LFVPLPLYPPPIPPQPVTYKAVRNDFNEATIILRGKEIEIQWNYWSGRGVEARDNVYLVTWFDVRDGAVPYGTGVYWFYRDDRRFILCGRHYPSDSFVGIGPFADNYEIRK
jgi:hypothetical protein